MDLRIITDKDKTKYNKLVNHVIQSWEWGEFRKSLGLPLLRYGVYQNGKLTKAFQLTLHKIPFTSQYVGYLPKGPLPDKELKEALEKIGIENNCTLIKVEPNVLVDEVPLYSIDPNFSPSPKPLFTKYNFLLDLTPSPETLLANLSQKTRYNVRLAQKKGVVVEERTDDKAFEIFLKMHFETTQRQGFHSHNSEYHRKLWKILRDADMARVLIAFYPSSPNSSTLIPLSAWMLFNFKDKLYYPYGASSIEYKEVMANNLVAWEAILLGKKLNCKTFDMWGAAHSPEPDRSDPYYGFHTFKKGYGGKLVEYLGTYDLIFNDPLYWAFNIVDKMTGLKVALLKLIGS
jgi:lipid II:glycine glycyltransferase (peptidoglycan interpeptide bridge formation enzyme)